jgi:lipopolysaccharide transport system permease protein
MKNKSYVSSVPTLVIRPSRGWAAIKFRELWQYRELIYFFVWRDIKVRYKQTVLGAAWAIIQPFVTMVVFSIFFGRLAKMPSDGIPYPIFTYCALLPWNYFAEAMNRASNSMVESANLIRKVYFPRLVVPLSAVISGLVDFAIAFTVLIAMMFYYKTIPKVTLLWFPSFMLMTIATALGVGLWLSSMNVRYRDIRYTIPFLTQLWFFITPVVYPSRLLPGFWRIVYGLNPMVSVIEGFRWALLSKGQQPGWMLAVSAAMVLILLISGAFYFRRMEKTFADIV